MEKDIKGIIEWLKDYLKNTGLDGFVLGLSGGVDSALVAALCEKAAPGKTLGVILPIDSDPEDEADALLVAEALGVETHKADLTEAFSALSEALEFKVPSSRFAKANIKPRLRMIALYYYANLLNRLVVGTDNRDERYLGYFTKFGDGAADIMPISHLSKSEVYEYARYLGVPEKIVQKTPTAGLWLGQTDENEMGFTYTDLHKYFAGEEISGEIAAKIERMHRTSRHKLELPKCYKDV